MEAIAVVNCTVLNVRAVRRGRLIALAAVEIDVDGVVLVLDGVRVFRFRVEGDHREMTGVGPPCYRDADGSWREAVRLPEGPGRRGPALHAEPRSRGAGVAGRADRAP